MADREPPLDPGLATAAVYASSFRTVQGSLQSTGFRTNTFRHDGLRLLDRDARVAEDFLVNSRLRRRDVEFEASVGAYFTESGALTGALVDHEVASVSDVSLPTPLKMPLALGEAVRRRRSVRAYTGESMPLSYAATLAWAGCGVTGRGRGAEGRVAVEFRSTPSGGALYPVELWLAALRVDGLEPAVYRYLSPRHRLRREGGPDALNRLMAAMAVDDEIIMCARANAICLLVARPWRSMRKYGARGMRHVFLEAGAIAEQIGLAAVALGLGSVDCSSVYDDDAHDAIGVDGVYEALVHALVVGTPA